MDIAHHALIGGAGFVALAAQDHELAGMAFVAGSVFPDLDVAFMAMGKQFYLRNHQGPTHSFVMAPLYALLVSSPVIVFLGFDWPTYVAARGRRTCHPPSLRSCWAGLRCEPPVSRSGLACIAGGPHVGREAGSRIRYGESLEVSTPEMARSHA